MDQIISTVIAAGVPTATIIFAFVRNETALAGLNARLAALEARIDGRFETLERRIDKLDSELREWARITMQHNTDVARLKDKTGLKD